MCWRGRRADDPNYQSPIPNPQSPIPNPQSPIPNPQSPIPNPQSPIPDPQSPIPNHPPPHPGSRIPHPRSRSTLFLRTTPPARLKSMTGVSPSASTSGGCGSRQNSGSSVVSATVHLAPRSLLKGPSGASRDPVPADLKLTTILRTHRCRRCGAGPRCPGRSRSRIRRDPATRRAPGNRGEARSTPDRLRTGRCAGRSRSLQFRRALSNVSRDCGSGMRSRRLARRTPGNSANSRCVRPRSRCCPSPARGR